jgi:preprotein translocase subunit SecF
MVRVPSVGVESGGSLSETRDAVEASLKQANLGNFTVVGTEIVGPAVGAELTSKGIWATVLSMLGILAYIAFRYQISFAVGAVVATLHDLLVVLAFLAFFQYDLTLNVIAAILTVTGYSTNDTIVIFDRVRENLRGMRRDSLSLSHVINVALNQTLGRTVITAGTAFLSSVALFMFGGEVLRGFAFTMIVGIVTGTYSSIFVAAAIVTMWRGQGARFVVADSHPGRSAGNRAGAHRVPARVINGALAHCRAAPRLRRSRRPVHGGDPARLDSRRRLVVPRQDRERLCRLAGRSAGASVRAGRDRRISSGDGRRCAAG